MDTDGEYGLHDANEVSAAIAVDISSITIQGDVMTGVQPEGEFTLYRIQ